MDVHTSAKLDPDTNLHFRIAAIAILLVTSAFGALLPILTKHYYKYHEDAEDSSKPNVIREKLAPAFFDFCKYLGSGVVISTAFCHLLSPAFEALKDPSLPSAWLSYDWAPVITMVAMFAIFTVELLAFRLGTGWLRRFGVDYETHGEAHSSHGPCEGEEDDPRYNPQPDGDPMSGVDGRTAAASTLERRPTSESEDAHQMTDEEALRAPFLPKSGKPANGSTASRKSLNKRFSSQKIIYGSIASGENGGPDQIAGMPSRASAGANAGRRHSSYHEHPHTPSRKSDQADSQTRRGSVQGNGHGSTQKSNKMSSDVASSIIGVAILEIGVLLHSFVIGLTLATVGKFLTLFIVITLHQMFEGLGLGARLANLTLPKSMKWVPILAGILYACITPVGLAIGLLVRKSYSPESPTALIVSGVLDSLSAGVLLYTGLVELLAAEFLFHQEMREAPLGRVLYALACVILGAAIMAVLGIWA